LYIDPVNPFASVQRKMIFQKIARNKNVLRDTIREMMCHVISRMHLFSDALKQMWTGKPTINFQDFVDSTNSNMDMVRKYLHTHEKLPGNPLKDKQKRALTNIINKCAKHKTVDIALLQNLKFDF